MKKQTTILLAGLLAGLTASNSLFAQQTVEEIVVTATKRSVQLEDLAGAANVIGADDLGPGGIENVRDLNIDVPSLSIGDQFGFARVFIRGIGMTSIDIGGEGAVSFLQDGAIVPRPAAQLIGMFDLDQIEVLRGPQGTLYGRGSTAGAINMVTAKPGEELGGYAQLSAGSFGLTTFEGAIDLPISSDFAVRLATKIEQRDGYGENKFSGDEVDDRNAQGYRATIQYEPDTSWDATLSIQYYEEDDHNYAFHYFGPSAGTSTPNPLAVPLLNGKTVGQVGGGFHDINSDQEAINEREGLLANLILNFDLSDRVSLRSVTSMQSLDRFLRDDLDSTDVNLFGQNNYTEESDSLGQEIILNYTGNNLDVIAGAMYFEEELFGEVFVPLTEVCLLPPIAAAAPICALPVGDAARTSARYLQDGDVDITAYAVFAEATYAFNSQWSVIAGVRYNYEEREGTGAFIFDALGLNVPTNQKADWDEITPRFTLQYEPTENALLYLTYTKAFKSGAINTGSTSPPLDPEIVDAYEFGVKGSAAGGQLSYSFSAFYYEYEDLQISFVDEMSTVSTINAAEAENYGLELEIGAAFANGLSIDFFATYLNAEYKEFTNGDYANAFAPTDLSGNTLPNAPEYTAKLGINYEKDVGNGALRFRVEGYYQDDVYFTEWNRDDAVQEGYALFNASVDYSFSDSWMISIWGRNLSDEEVISNNIITAPLYDSLRVGSVLPPRTYGVTVGFQF